MNELMYINDDILQELDNYLALPSPPGILLNGVHGLGKKKTAYYLASRLLSCKIDKLRSHPDFFVVGEDKMAIKVEDIEALMETSFRCSVGKRKVFLILRGHTMTMNAQNRLLKLLEDRGKKNILIFTSEENSILPTIASRCCSVHFHPLKNESMMLFLKKAGVDEDFMDFICFLLSNAPYLYQSYECVLSDYLHLYHKICSLSCRADLFPTLHYLREKDKDAFYDCHKDYIQLNIRMVLFPFYDYLLTLSGLRSRSHVYPANLYSPGEALSVLETGMKHLGYKNYTKNDFFDLLRFVVQIR